MAKKTPSILKEIQNHTLREVNYSYQKSISFSQLQLYVSCPHKWDLTYRQKLTPYQDSIHTIFGTAIHEVMQDYIKVMYEVSGVAADKINLEETFQDKFTSLYKEAYKRNNKSHFSSPEEMREFYDDGVAILDYLKKNKSNYFSKRGWHLVGIEVPLVIVPNSAYKNVIYKGYLDLVLYNETTNKFVIYDIKTSTWGWGDKEKKDDMKTFQLVFYKNFYSKQFNVPEENIDVEFLIVKRKMYESEFALKRFQTFIPASGKIKTKKALTLLNEFIENCFDKNGDIQVKEYTKLPSKTSCGYCVFANKPELCDKNL
jgi:hypothetical protein